MIFGCRPSRSRASLIGSAGAIVLPQAATSVDLRSVHTFTENNNNIEEVCVGDAFEEAHQVVTRGRSARLSPLSVWRGARLRERESHGTPILNVGCNPADAVDYSIQIGPYKRDANDDDPAKMNDMEDWAEAVGCVPFQAEDFAVVDDGDVDTLRRWLTFSQQNYNDPTVDRLACPMGAMQIYPSYQAIRDLTPWNGPRSDEAPMGGHYQVPLGYTGDGLMMWSSWPGHGQDGIVVIGWSFVQSSMFDWYVMKGGPLFS